MEQNASDSESVFCTFVDKNDHSKYLCFTQKKAGCMCVGLTNAEDVWKADLSEEAVAQLRKKFSLKSSEDFAKKLKSACDSGSAFVSLDKDSAVLQFGREPGEIHTALAKLGDSEAKAELKDVLFRIADRLRQQESQGVPPSFSPVKSPQKRNAEFEPRMQRQNTAAVVRKRLPGDSLINPGTRRKRPATGVAFDDENDGV
ncbi:protein PAXX [Chanos chanos]|uniref:Protein PAXX n=1 Tax=Chanos chanos TaxID=29144 RepID=A0A6J2WTU3_CHACN|nr:protein PAXX [Chanos chanos]